jgi:hypothetical protein
MGALPFRDITRYFCEANSSSVLVPHRINYDRGLKTAAVLTHTPAFRFKASSFTCHPQGLLRDASL